MRALLLCLFLLIVGCTDRSLVPVVPEALDIGSPVRILAATSRQQDENGIYGAGRAGKLGFLDLTVSVPPAHKVGVVDFAYAHPRPETQFTLARQDELASSKDFLTRLRDALHASRTKEIMLFVHGYNYTQNESAFRAAQIEQDFDHGGVTVIYSWPSQGRALGYAYDLDSMLFARSGLEQVVDLLGQGAPKGVFLVAHSMGAALTMETIQLAESRRPGWAARRLSGVALMSPDIDVDVFRAQFRTIRKAPQPFFVFASQKDGALNISARIRGSNPQSRLGRIETLDKVADLPVQVIDTTAFDADAASGHFVAGTSPALVDMLRKLPAITEQLGSDSPSLVGLVTGNPADDSGRQAVLLQLQPDNLKR